MLAPFVSLIMRLWRWPFFRFALVGTGGFVVDAGLLWLLLQAGFDPYSGRIFSYIAAASFTFACNRIFTFVQHSRETVMWRQWALFLGVNLGGFALNYGAYVLLLLTVPLVAAYPLLGVAAGSLAGLLFNFSASKKWVFR